VPPAPQLPLIGARIRAIVGVPDDLRAELEGGMRCVRFVAVVIAGGCAWGGIAGVAQAGDRDGRAVTVMTRNVYIGTDLDPIFAASTPAALRLATATAFGNVQATNFPARAQALAGEIATAQPDLVGLQEVELIRTGPVDDPAPATNVPVSGDYLALLLAALEARGLDYAPVAINVNADVEVPSALGLDVRVTDRDVILARGRTLRKVKQVQEQNFATNLTLRPLGVPITIVRGWSAVDVKLRGRRVRFLNTHLEPSSAAVQVAQGNELLAGPADTRLPLIFVGDFNSPAEGTGTPTYANLLAAGFTDAWSQAEPGAAGLTCCHASDLLNQAPTLSRRIDLVLLRRGHNDRGLVAKRAEVVGDQQGDQLPSGLWPSDHAGVVATLRATHRRGRFGPRGRRLPHRGP
jgi:endonuclease/exonuclease/phosphatase family metal-dependent hydrolase